MTDYLLIPPAGLIQVTEGTKYDIEAALTESGADGVLIHWDLIHDGSPVGALDWMVNGIGPINDRARDAVHYLVGVHAIFTGPVMFTDLRRETIGELIAHLSR